MSTTEHMQTLAGASLRIRSRRAELRQEIHALPYRQSRALAADVLRNPAEWCEGMTVYRLLTAIRWFGPHRAHHVLARAQVADGKVLGNLTERQRNVLVGELT